MSPSLDIRWRDESEGTEDSRDTRPGSSSERGRDGGRIDGGNLVSAADVLTIAGPLLTAISALAATLWRMEKARCARLEAEKDALTRENRRYLALILGAAESPGGVDELRKELARMIRESTA